MATQHDLYLDERYCPTCARYVAYFRSPDGAWCAFCGDEVSLVSFEDQIALAADRRARRGKRGEVA